MPIHSARHPVDDDFGLLPELGALLPPGIGEHVGVAEGVFRYEPDHSPAAQLQVQPPHRLL